MHLNRENETNDPIQLHHSPNNHDFLQLYHNMFIKYFVTWIAAHNKNVHCIIMENQFDSSKINTRCHYHSDVYKSLYGVISFLCDLN